MQLNELLTPFKRVYFHHTSVSSIRAVLGVSSRLPSRPRLPHATPLPVPQPAAAPRASDCTIKLSLGRLLHVPEINEAKSGEVDCFIQYTWPVQDGEWPAAQSRPGARRCFVLLLK